MLSSVLPRLRCLGFRAGERILRILFLNSARKDSQILCTHSYISAFTRISIHTHQHSHTHRSPHHPLPAIPSHPAVITMSQSRTPQPSQGSSRPSIPYVPPPNPLAPTPVPPDTNGYHGNPQKRVCRVVFSKPSQGGLSIITVQEIDGKGDLPGQGRTMDLVADSSKSEGRSWHPFISTVNLEFVPIGPDGSGLFGLGWIRRN